MTSIDQLLLQFQVVFNDAVMDYGDTRLTVDVGVGIFMGRASVCSPAGVPKPNRTLELVGDSSLIKPVDLTYSFADLEVTLTVYNGDTSAIVAPVFQPPQALVNNRPGILLTDVPNNAAHRPSRPLLIPFDRNH